MDKHLRDKTGTGTPPLPPKNLEEKRGTCPGKKLNITFLKGFL
jgi:hypothetical protein